MHILDQLLDWFVEDLSLCSGEWSVIASCLEAFYSLCAFVALEVAVKTSMRGQALGLSLAHPLPECDSRAGLTNLSYAENTLLRIPS